MSKWNKLFFIKEIKSAIIGLSITCIILLVVIIILVIVIIKKNKK